MVGVCVLQNRGLHLSAIVEQIKFNFPLTQMVQALSFFSSIHS